MTDETPNEIPQFDALFGAQLTVAAAEEFYSRWDPATRALMRIVAALVERLAEQHEIEITPALANFVGMLNALTDGWAEVVESYAAGMEVAAEEAGGDPDGYAMADLTRLLKEFDDPAGTLAVAVVMLASDVWDDEEEPS